LVIDQKARILHDFFEFFMSLMSFCFFSPRSLCRAAVEKGSEFRPKLFAIIVYDFYYWEELRSSILEEGNNQ